MSEYPTSGAFVSSESSIRRRSLEGLFESAAQRLPLPVVCRGLESKQLCDEVIDIDVLKTGELRSWADVGAICDEDRLHLGHAGYVVAVFACRWLSGTVVDANVVGAIGHNDWITFAWVFVEVEIGWDFGSAIGCETGVWMCAEALVCFLCIRFGLRIEERAFRFEVR